MLLDHIADHIVKSFYLENALISSTAQQCFKKPYTCDKILVLLIAVLLFTLWTVDIPVVSKTLLETTHNS
jgi:hypothetical protein